MLPLFIKKKGKWQHYILWLVFVHLRSPFILGTTSHSHSILSSENKATQLHNAVFAGAGNSPFFYAQKETKKETQRRSLVVQWKCYRLGVRGSQVQILSLRPARDLFRSLFYFRENFLFPSHYDSHKGKSRGNSVDASACYLESLI